MTVIDPELLGSRLRDLRLTRGLTQEQLASPNYTHAYVSTIEAGRRTPSEEAIRHFANKLGVDEDEIRNGTPTNLLPELELDLQEARAAVSRGELDAARKVFSKILRTAKRYKTTYQQAKAHEGLGLCFERSNELDDAMREYLLAERLLADDPPNTKADAVAGQARCAHLQGDRHHAIYLLESLLERLRRQTLEDPDALIRIYTSLAIIYVKGDYLTQASHAADEALRLADHVSDPARLGAMHNMVARVLLGRGDTDEAWRSLQKAEHYYRIAELELEVGRARLTKGIYLIRVGKHKQAAQELSAALEVFVSTRSPLDEGRAATELGRLAREKGEVDAAKDFLSQAIKRSQGHPAQLARAYRERGLTLAKSSKTAAKADLETAIKLFLDATEPVQVAITHAYLGDMLSDHVLRGSCKIYRNGLAVLEKQHIS